MLTARRNRRLAAAIALLCLIGVLAPTGVDASVGSAVMIDDFEGGADALPSRSVSTLPQGDSTTSNGGTYTFADGKMQITTGGNGNTAGAVIATWSGGPIDLTGGANNTQLLLELDQVQRTNPQNDWESAASITVEVFDTYGTQATSGSIGISNTFAHNIAIPFECTGGSTTCLSPTPHWDAITSVRLSIHHPTNYDGSRTTSTVVNRLWATPPGGIAPAPPTATIDVPSTVFAPSEEGVTFDVGFTSGGLPAPVTAVPQTDAGLTADGLTVGGTAPGPRNLAISGGPSHYTVQVTGMTGDGTVTLAVDEGAVADAWSQDNPASTTASSAFTLAVPPTLADDPLSTTTALAGTPFSATLSAGGHPTPTLTAAGLPSGLSLSDHGDGTGTVSGTVAAGAPGSVDVTFTATNVAGSASQTVTLTIHELLSVASGPDDVLWVDGVADAATWTFAGNPAVGAATVTERAGHTLDGATLDTSGDELSVTYDGSGVAVGDHVIDVDLTTEAGTTRFTRDVRVVEPIVLTSPTVLAGAVGDELTHDIIATGTGPLAVTATGLPAWATLEDHGDGTATISGTPPVGAAGVSSFTIDVVGAAGTLTESHDLTITSGPVAVESASTTISTGDALDLALGVDLGYPVADVTTSGLPTWMTAVVEDGDVVLTSDPTTPAQAGVHELTVTLSNVHGTQVVDVTVTVLDPAGIVPATPVMEAGRSGSATITADGFPLPSLSASGLPTWLDLLDLGDGTATLTGDVPVGAGGIHDISVTADNGHSTDTAVVAVTVVEAPQIADPGTIRVAAHGTLDGTFAVRGWPVPTLEVAGLPDGITATIDGRSLRMTGTPTATGRHEVDLTFTNDHGTHAATLVLEVTAAPNLSGPATASMTAGSAAEVQLTATGWEQPTVSVAAPLPAGLSLADHGGGDVRISGTPAPGSGGVHAITVTAANPSGDDAHTITVTIDEAPTWGTLAPAAVTVGGAPAAHTVQVGGYPVPTISATAPLPSGLTLTDNGDGTATLSGTPAPGTGGAYAVPLRATNRAGDESTHLSLTVAEASVVPEAPTDGGDVDPDEPLDVTIGATGHPTPTLTPAAPLPSGLTFVDNGDGTGTLAGTPARGAGGRHEIVIVVDNGVGTPQQQTIVVEIFEGADLDDPGRPAPAPLGEAIDLRFRSVGWPRPALSLDPPAGPVGLASLAGVRPAATSSGLPDGLTFVDNGDGTASIVGTPGPGTAGRHTLTVYASNEHGTSSLPFTFEIHEAATVSVADLDGTSRRTTAGHPVELTVTTTGFPVAAITASGLPPGLRLVDHGDGTATISGTVAVDAVATWPVRVVADNGAGDPQAATFDLIVVAPPAAPADDERPAGRRDALGGQSLPRTGSDARAPIVAGLGLVVLGAGLVVGGRRRRTA
ncbi:beta strand repeat-containing protein [Actinomarinicola tropica]|uniref:LPXTG cell wall anchor domain-containing protein n=1 Tax=Actinomarinicola tropica TaxID=2789776 RepID=A0A5Q2RP77_9ACTN|nr:Ig domain-containing protein [Actinomarinicola tropica]QGG96236.1 LPXTG cell wall anchor domain-containing protein [Actinomarinicola tropica]